MSGNVVELLDIVNKARQWPNLKALHDLAMADLVAANDEATTELAKRADAAAKAKAEADAKAAAEAAAKAEAEAPKAVSNE